MPQADVAASRFAVAASRADGALRRAAARRPTTPHDGALPGQSAQAIWNAEILVGAVPMTSLACSAFDGGATALALRLDRRADGTVSAFPRWCRLRGSGAPGPAARAAHRQRRIDDPSKVPGRRRRAGKLRPPALAAAPKAFDGRVMTIRPGVAANPLVVADFNAYAWQRHLDRVAGAAARGAVACRLGASVQRRAIGAHARRLDHALVDALYARPPWREAAR